MVDNMFMTDYPDTFVHSTSLDSLDKWRSPDKWNSTFSMAELPNYAQFYLTHIKNVMNIINLPCRIIEVRITEVLLYLWNHCEKHYLEVTN